MGVEAVADPSLEGADRLLAALVLGELALVVNPTFLADEADLGDRDHVDGVVELAMRRSESRCTCANAHLGVSDVRQPRGLTGEPSDG
jgi:hypothetical protein